MTTVQRIPTTTKYLNELTPHPENYNTHPASQIKELAESLSTFGQFKNIVCWTCPENMTTPEGHELHEGLTYILAGHGLWLAAMEAGVDDLEVKDYSGLSYEMALGLLLVDNAAPLGSVPIVAALASLLERAREPMADKPRLAAMLERLRVEAGINGNGSAPPEPSAPTEIEAEKYHKKWQVQPGEIWECGPHLVACLDSLDEANIKRVVADSTVTFAFADPPYGINIVAANGYVGGGEAYDIPFGGVTPVRNRGQASKGYVGGGARIKASPGLYPIQTWAKNRPRATVGGSGRDKPFGSKAYRAANGGGAGRDNIVDQGKYYPVAGDSTTATAKQSAALLLSLYPDACHVWWGANYYTDVLSPSPCWIIWDKDNTGNFADCEMAWTNQPTAARIFEHRWNGMLKASEQGQRRIHPTQKPVALPRYCFEAYGESGDVIIDPFLGSGITVLAAEELGDRRVIGFELEPVYVSTVLERWSQLTGQTPRRATRIGL